MPLKELLDPQGKAVMSGLKNLGLNKVNDVRIGKNITLRIDADNEEQDAEYSHPYFHPVMQRELRIFKRAGCGYFIGHRP